MASHHNSKRETAEFYRSLCDVRMSCELGCKGCMLDGYVECPRSKGNEPNVGHLIDPRNSSSRCRSFEGFKCSLNGYGSGFSSEFSRRYNR